MNPGGRVFLLLKTVSKLLVICVSVAQIAKEFAVIC